MRVKKAIFPGLFALLGVACLGPSQPADNTCESLGGVCVSGNAACSGSLPYSCDQGVCCTAGQASPDAAAPTSDGG
jgi:hypothetical protein